jgi:N-methylhydantoinase A
VIGAVRQAGRSGFGDLITFDMGGTSTDVCLIADGKPDLASETEVDGLPIRTPVLDIVTVGAGGGSLIWVDDGGLLRAGPQSAGADPGPACYCRGGEQATVTDAHMIRGTVRPEAFLGGKMTVDAALSAKVFQPVAERFGMTLEEAADSAIRVAENNIVRAIQLVSTERGRDPRDYTLVPYGGAGPLHAARVAEELGIRTILVPPNAGVLSAAGLLVADFVRYETRTRRLLIEEGVEAAVRETFAAMTQTISDYYRELGLTGDLHLHHSLDMRYVGQAFEVTVDLTPEELERMDGKLLFDAFDAAHHRVFEFGASPHSRAEIVSFRLGAAVPAESVPAFRESETPLPDAAESTVFDRGEQVTCRLITRTAFRDEGRLSGPALVEDNTSTIYLPRGWTGRIDEYDNLILERDPAARA